MRRAAKRDIAEPDIVATLRNVGCSVTQLSGEDIPDLLVGYRKRTYLLEVKTGTAPLKPGQRRWHDGWEGHPVALVRNAREALDAIGFTWRKPNETPEGA